MILEHTFEEETHLYKVPGQFVLSTSDVISLNGLADYGSIPKAVLDHASFRGTQLHKAIQFFEEDGDIPEMSDEVLPYFRGYMKFRLDYDFEPIGELEKQIVYVHEGTEQPIGCTIDLRGLVNGKPYILDIKTTAAWPENSQCKDKKKKCLAWRCQLASYTEATAFDHSWWMGCNGTTTGEYVNSIAYQTEDRPPMDLSFDGSSCGKAIVQVNKDAGYEFHDFSTLDDSLLWDSAVRMAIAKLGAGFQMERR